VAGVIVEAFGSGAAAYEASLDLRFRVMYEPFGLGRELAPGREPLDSVHLGAFDGESLVGYARLVPWAGDTAKVFQVVVEPERQGRGLGTALMRALLDRASADGARAVVLDAREHAVGFYEGFGFRATGDIFISPRTGTPHLPMALDL
jgi:predicted GNAT family N-acyltransferase